MEIHRRVSAERSPRIASDTAPLSSGGGRGDSRAGRRSGSGDGPRTGRRAQRLPRDRIRRKLGLIMVAQSAGSRRCGLGGQGDVKVDFFQDHLGHDRGHERLLGRRLGRQRDGILLPAGEEGSDFRLEAFLVGEMPGASHPADCREGQILRAVGAQPRGKQDPDRPSGGAALAQKWAERWHLLLGARRLKPGNGFGRKSQLRRIS